MIKPIKQDLIKIIPKAKPEMPAIIGFLFWLGVVLIIVLIAGSFFLQAETAGLKKEKANIEDQLIVSGKDKELEKSLNNTSKKIKDFSRLIKEHTTASGFFEFLKSYCHPQAYFTTLRLYNRDLSASLVGQTENFQTLAEQILSLKTRQGIDNFQITNISLTRQGNVEFSFIFDFPEELISSKQ